jgi:hypothetical protein
MVEKGGSIRPQLLRDLSYICPEHHILRMNQRVKTENEIDATVGDHLQ